MDACRHMLYYMTSNGELQLSPAGLLVSFSLTDIWEKRSSPKGLGHLLTLACPWRDLVPSTSPSEFPFVESGTRMAMGAVDYRVAVWCCQSVAWDLTQCLFQCLLLGIEPRWAFSSPTEVEKHMDAEILPQLGRVTVHENEDRQAEEGNTGLVGVHLLSHLSSSVAPNSLRFLLVIWHPIISYSMMWNPKAMDIKMIKFCLVNFYVILKNISCAGNETLWLKSNFFFFLTHLKRELWTKTA